MKKIEIYDTHPWIVIMKSGNIFHLTDDDYEYVAKSWLERDTINISEYLDPETMKPRPLMLDGLAIEMIDDAPHAQEEHWVKQGGYVCKYKTFHTKHEFCECKPKQKTPKEMADSQTDSGMQMKPPETWAGTEAEWGEHNVKKMRAAFNKKNKEIKEIYSAIEKKLVAYGLEWCEVNRESWVEYSRTCNAKIDYYNLFKLRHPSRFQQAFEKHEKGKKVKEVDVIPF